MAEQTPAEALADAVLREWLGSRRSASAARPPPSERLIDAYRSLTRAILCQNPALEAGGGDPDDEPATGAGGASSEDLLPRLAKAVRADRRSIAQVLRDLTDLGPALLRALRARGAVPSAEVVADFDIRMGTSTVRLVEMLEATSLRERREHEDTLATMTEILSHELQNRLGAARTAADVLLHPDLGIDHDAVTRGARLVRNSIDDALRTVDDVRALTARQANLDEPRRRVTSLPELIRVLVEDARAGAYESGVEVVVDGELPEASVDAARVRLILVNLLQNGIKYRSEEEEEPRVSVSATRSSDGRIVLRVADNGVGIPSGDLDDIFLPRFRGHVADGVSGSGLGLSIVEEAVEQIGGRIDIDSRVGEGTVFAVSFPTTVTGGPAANG